MLLMEFIFSNIGRKKENHLPVILFMASVKDKGGRRKLFLPVIDMFLFQIIIKDVLFG